MAFGAGEFVEDLSSLQESDVHAALLEVYHRSQELIRPIANGATDDVLEPVRGYLDPLRQDLMELAQREAPRYQALAIYLLGLTRPTDDSVGILHGLALSERNETKRLALTALASFSVDDADTREIVMSEVRSGEDLAAFRLAARMAAGWGLGEAIEHIEGRLHHEDPAYRFAAAQALGKFNVEQRRILGILREREREEPDQRVKTVLSAVATGIDKAMRGESDAK